MLTELSEFSASVFESSVVSDCSIQCRQQPVGVVTLEHKLLSAKTKVDEPRSKRRKTTADNETSEDPVVWVDVAR